MRSVPNQLGDVRTAVRGKCLHTTARVHASLHDASCFHSIRRSSTTATGQPTCHLVHPHTAMQWTATAGAGSIPHEAALVPSQFDFIHTRQMQRCSQQLVLPSTQPQVQLL